MSNSNALVTFPCAGAQVTLDAAAIAALWIAKMKAAPAAQQTLATPPKIGQYWPGQGGIYAGLAAGRDGAPDYHLIVSDSVVKDVEWEAAKTWAGRLTADGHDDFALPSRKEQALLFANVAGLFDPEWYWSGEAYASNAGYAWCQTFGTGGQYCDPIDSELRARAVRRLTV